MAASAKGAGGIREVKQYSQSLSDSQGPLRSRRFTCAGALNAGEQKC